MACVRRRQLQRRARRTLSLASIRRRNGLNDGEEEKEKEEEASGEEEGAEEDGVGEAWGRAQIS